MKLQLPHVLKKTHGHLAAKSGTVNKKELTKEEGGGECGDQMGIFNLLIMVNLAHILRYPSNFIMTDVPLKC